MQHHTDEKKKEEVSVLLTLLNYCLWCNYCAACDSFYERKHTISLHLHYLNILEKNIYPHFI